MASLSSWPDPQGLSRCFTLVRWLHANGISWSGTAAELTAQLRQDSDSSLWFADSDELLQFLQSNDDTLRQLGLETAVRKIPGRPRLIELNLTEESPETQKSGPVQVAAPIDEPGLELKEPEALKKEPIQEKWESLLPPELIEQLKDPEEAKQAEPVKVPESEPVSRLYSLLGLTAEDAAAHEHVEPSYEARRPAYYATVDSSEEESSWTRFLPIAIVALITVVLAVAVVALVRRSNSSRVAQPVVTNDSEPASEPPVELDPVEVKKANALLQQAATSKNATAQYELGTCYRDGKGVQRDYAAALAWLNLAKANGSTSAQSDIRTLSQQVSTADAQKARIAIGKAFAAGTAVPRNYVIAHNWFSVAELAGSSEATKLRKQLESKMSEGQLQRARSTGR